MSLFSIRLKVVAMFWNMIASFFLAGWLDDYQSCSQNQLDHFKMITGRNIKDYINNNNNKLMHQILYFAHKH